MLFEQQLPDNWMMFGGVESWSLGVQDVGAEERSESGPRLWEVRSRFSRFSLEMAKTMGEMVPKKPQGEEMGTRDTKDMEPELRWDSGKWTHTQAVEPGDRWNLGQHQEWCIGSHRA